MVDKATRLADLAEGALRADWLLAAFPPLV
jgi:hypothetical protein